MDRARLLTRPLPHLENAPLIQDLSVGCGAYDRTWPLIAKTISVEGASLAWTILPPEEIFLRGMLGHEFDVTKMSFSSYPLQVCE